MPRYFVFDAEHQIVPATFTEWGDQTDDAEACRVGRDRVGEYRVSTVFLGIDQDYGPVPTPFETMVFGGRYDTERTSHATWADAEAGHRAVVQRLRLGRAPFE